MTDPIKPVSVRVDARSKGELVIEGVDFAPLCRGFRLDASVDSLPILTLFLNLDEGAEGVLETAVRLSYEVEYALKQLGWTPPAEPNDQDDDEETSA
jgi:hypothetical protein